MLARLRTLMGASPAGEGQPLLTELVRRFGLDLSILHGQIDEVQGQPFGTLAVFARGAADQLQAGIAHLRQAGVNVQPLAQESAHV